jgi:hypothetical protein
LSSFSFGKEGDEEDKVVDDAPAQSQSDGRRHAWHAAADVDATISIGDEMQA